MLGKYTIVKYRLYKIKGIKLETNRTVMSTSKHIYINSFMLLHVYPFNSYLPVYQDNYATNSRCPF